MWTAGLRGSLSGAGMPCAIESRSVSASTLFAALGLLLVGAAVLAAQRPASRTLAFGLTVSSALATALSFWWSYH